MKLTTTLAAITLACAASIAEAQICLGTASFATGPIRIDGSFSTIDDATSLSVGASVGAPRGPFVSVNVNRTDIDEVDESATGFGILGGLELDLSTSASSRSARFSLCPVASFNYSTADFDLLGESVEFSANTLSAGLALGAEVTASPTLSVIPFGALSVVRQSVDFEGFGEDAEESETGGSLDLGLGLVLNRRFTIRPLISIPLGFEGADPAFGVSVHFNFGRSR
jgi:hypothetical protein